MFVRVALCILVLKDTKKKRFLHKTNKQKLQTSDTKNKGQNQVSVLFLMFANSTMSDYY